VRHRFWIAAVLVVLLDQLTKYLVQTQLGLHSSVTVVPGVLQLTHVHNPGVAFGQLSGGGPLLVLAALAACVGIVIYRSRLLGRGQRLHPMLELGLALPLGGAIGNAIDRIYQGKVVDFIDVGDLVDLPVIGRFPVFNIADSAITVGAVALLIYFLVILRPESDEHAEHGRAVSEAAEQGG